MILTTIEQLADQYSEAARVRARTYVGKGKAGDVGPVVCADGSTLDVLSVGLPLGDTGRSAVDAWEARAAAASWPVGRSVRVEAVNGASEPLGSRSIPGHHWSGAAAPGAATVRPPWGPAGPGVIAAPLAEPAPPWIDEAPRWPESVEVMTGGARPALGGPRPAVVTGDPVAILAATVDRLLRHTEAILAQNSALVQASVASQNGAHQTAARVLVESAAQHGQTARSAHAQLAALSGTVARAAADAQQRADDEAALSRAASEAAAEADKAAAVSEVLRAGAAQAGGGDDRWSQMLKLATAALGSGAVKISGPRPAEAAPQLGAPVEAQPAQPVEVSPWPDQLVAALMAAHGDPEAGAKLAAVGAMLPADVRAAIAGGVA